MSTNCLSIVEAKNSFLIASAPTGITSKFGRTAIMAIILGKNITQKIELQ